MVPALHLQALLVSLFLTSVALAQRVGESEPNDTAATATLAPMGAQMDAMLDPGEEDWYAFTVTSTSTVVLFTSPLSPTTVDTVLTLFDATGTTMLAENDDQRDLLSDITIELPAGNYCVRVTGFLPVTTGSYSLDFASTAPIAFTAAEAAEPNASMSTATNLACGEEVSGELTAGDSDWYKLVLTAPRTGIVLHVMGGGAPQLKPFDWQILNDSGALLSDTALGDNSGSSRANGPFIRRCWTAGTYYFVMSSSSAGKYRLECAAMPMNVGGQVNEGAGATSIGVGDFGIGSLSAGGEADLWGPISVSTGYLMAQLLGNGASPLTAARVELLDHRQRPFTVFNRPIGFVSGGNILDPGGNARGTWRIDGIGGGDVYLRVTAPPNNTGGYRLEVGGCGRFSGPTWFSGSGKTGGIDNVTCVGSNGQRPWLASDSFYELPVLGSTYVRYVELAPSNGFAFFLQGLTDIVPVDLAFLGAPGCFLDVDLQVVTFTVTDASGRAEFVQLVPNALALSGVRVFEQVLVFDPFANPLGFTLSNSDELTLGSLSY